MRAFLLCLLIACPVAAANPTDAERFTHIAGVSLLDLPSPEALAKKFGAARVTQTGDASTADTRVCYQASDKSLVVEFFNGEVDWGFKLRKPRGIDQCPATTGLSAQTEVAGVRLGMAKADYIALVGKPKSVTKRGVQHMFEYVHKLTDQELAAMIDKGRRHGYPNSDPESLRKWDVGIVLRAAFERNLLVSFTVDRVETN